MPFATQAVGGWGKLKKGSERELIVELVGGKRGMARMENGKTLVAKGLMNVNKFDGIFRKSGHEPMYVRRV